MPSMASSIGILLALASATVTQGCVAQGCQTADACHDQVEKLLHRMEKSVKFDKPPNPSILLAMNLAGATHGHVHRWLLQEIKKDAVERAQTDMTSGEVALYILALLSSCQDPQCVHAMGKTVHLVPILKEKMNEEISRKEITWYNESLDILALCLVKEYDIQDAVKAVAEELLKCGSSLDVGTRAMAVLALVCAYNHTVLKPNPIPDAIKAVTNDFLDEQERRHGIIGNFSSMGLALQALETSSEFYAPRKWDRAQAFSVVCNHDYQQPTAMAQVLPPLVDKSYLNAAPITVHYSITNTLKNFFHYTTSVCVPDNSTLLQVMEVARNEKPDIFCFTIKMDKLGPYVTSIHGLAGNMANRTYWQFFSSWSRLQKGVGTYKPRDGEHIQAIFSTY